jgi:hypothetical protein
MASPTATTSPHPDRLSALPVEMLVKVLHNLPVRDMCRTRVLSSFFRKFVDTNVKALTHPTITFHLARIKTDIQHLQDITHLSFQEALGRYVHYFGINEDGSISKEVVALFSIYYVVAKYRSGFITHWTIRLLHFASKITAIRRGQPEMASAIAARVMSSQRFFDSLAQQCDDKTISNLLTYLDETTSMLLLQCSKTVKPDYAIARGGEFGVTERESGERSSVEAEAMAEEERSEDASEDVGNASEQLGGTGPNDGESGCTSDARTGTELLASTGDGAQVVTNDRPDQMMEHEAEQEVELVSTNPQARLLAACGLPGLDKIQLFGYAVDSLAIFELVKERAADPTSKSTYLEVAAIVEDVFITV